MFNSFKLSRPRLPSLNKCQNRSINLSGSEIQYSIPPYDHKWGGQLEYPIQFNLFDDKIYGIGEDLIPFLQCFETTWRIKGFPIFQKQPGWILFSISVTRLAGYGTLFNKQRCELALTDCYIKLFGPNGKNREYSFEVFMNWFEQWIQGTDWVTYLAIEDGVGSISYSSIWVAPVTEEHVLTFDFRYKNYQDDKAVHQAVREYAVAIMQSVTINLSPSAQAQKDAADKQWPNQRYSTNKEPLRWIRPKKEGYLTLEEYLEQLEEDGENVDKNSDEGKSAGSR